MELPSTADLAEKRYLVKTDDRPTSLLFLNSIAKWLGTFDQVHHYIAVLDSQISLLVVNDCFCLFRRVIS